MSVYTDHPLLVAQKRNGVLQFDATMHMLEALVDFLIEVGVCGWCVVAVYLVQYLGGETVQ